ncbi:MAG: fatty acid desaturase [Pseudomonadota bacterium]|nr:fatty acid desaturase [Pseudomonadota bacterium]
MSTVTAENAKWVDGKRYLWLLSPAIPYLITTAFLAYFWLDASFLLWTGPLFVYLIIPALDFLIGTDATNPPESAVADLEEDKYYRWTVYAYIPAQIILTIFGAWMVTTYSLSFWEIVGIVLSVGAVNGIGINTAHELGHKKEPIERFLAKVVLMPVAYGHFETEHNKGHHVNVSTPHDPATSRLGEPFWLFLPKTFVGSLTSAWNIEKKRLNRLGKPVFSLENENLRAWSMTVVFFGAITAAFGWWALAFLVVQALYGISLLEVVNYLEHYGLLRKKLPNGRYERCKPEHSWNSNHLITNLFLYQLQRHSDHHANPVRRYQALRDFKDSPQLPSGYASMIVVAMIPPLWFKIMNKRVLAHYDGDITKAHLYPPKREKLLLQYGGQEAVEHEEEGKQIKSDSALTEVKKYSAEDYKKAHAFICTGDLCGFIYNEEEGNEHEGFAPGTKWEEIPDNWACPDCGVREKLDFIPYDPEAGKPLPKTA